MQYQANFNAILLNAYCNANLIEKRAKRIDDEIMK